MPTSNIPNHGDWLRGPDGHIAGSLAPQPWIITKELPPGYWLCTDCKIGRTASGNSPEAVQVPSSLGRNQQTVKIQVGWLRPELKRYHSGQKMYLPISFFQGMDNRIVRGTKTPNGQDEKNWTILAAGQAAAIQVTTFVFTKQFFKFKSSIPKGASEFEAWNIPGESPKEFQAVSDGQGGVTWATL